MLIDEDFTRPMLDPRWTLTCVGGGSLDCTGSVVRLTLPESSAGRYADAQIDDYDHLPRRRFPWRPPLRLAVRARASHAQPLPVRAPGVAGTSTEGRTLVGTAGFGFWNYPFSLSGSVLTLPDAVWFFFASPPSNLALVPGVPGWGWKAQVVHAHRWGALAAAVPTAAAVGWARMSGHDRAGAAWMRRLSGAAETQLLPALSEWHDYVLEWRSSSARFWLDGALVLQAPAPAGPLGFVVWIDNQYAVATPRGELRFGTLATSPQWLELDYVRIASL